jgi:hypothetical protein
MGKVHAAHKELYYSKDVKTIRNVKSRSIVKAIGGYGSLYQTYIIAATH